MSTYQHINTWTHQHIDVSIHRYINTLTRRCINTYQHINAIINTSTHWHINTSRVVRKRSCCEELCSLKRIVLQKKSHLFTLFCIFISLSENPCSSASLCILLNRLIRSSITHLSLANIPFSSSTLIGLSEFLESNETIKFLNLSLSQKSNHDYEVLIHSKLCVDVLMNWCIDVLMCGCVDVLKRWCVDVLMCWCVDVLMCWYVDVLMCWCVDVLISNC